MGSVCWIAKFGYRRDAEPVWRAAKLILGKGVEETEEKLQAHRPKVDIRSNEEKGGIEFLKWLLIDLFVYCVFVWHWVFEMIVDWFVCLLCVCLLIDDKIQNVSEIKLE